MGLSLINLRLLSKIELFEPIIYILVSNKWIHQTGQELKHPCLLHQDHPESPLQSPMP